MEAFLPVAYAFMLVLFRTVALITVAPIFSMRGVPARVRLAVAITVAFAIFVGAGAPSTAIPDSIGGLIGAGLTETIIGMLAGLGASLVLSAAQGAGHLAGLSMGFSYGSLIDPVNGAESNALQQVLMLCALGVAIALGLHRELIAWLARSIVEFPVGTSHDLLPFLETAIRHATYSIALSVRLAVPMLAAVTLGNVALGILGRSVPQLSLSSVGFSVGIVAGGCAFYMLAPVVAEIAARAAVTTLAR